MRFIRRTFKLLTIFSVLVIVAAVLVGIFAPSVEDESGKPNPTPDDTLSEIIKQMAIGTITEYEKVLAADIKQDGKDLTLKVFVAYGTSKPDAKEMGDNFVRLIKALGPEPSPGQEIGKGTFNYLVGVFAPDGKKIVMGAKARTSKSMTW
jgi:hypothetical protein